MLDYSYFKDHYKLIAIDLSKQQALDADPRAIQQINFTAYLDRDGNTTMLDFSQGTVKVLWMHFPWMKFRWIQMIV